VFALLFGVYVDARAKDPGLFVHSQAILDKDYGVINTMLLLSSSLMVVTAVRAMRAGLRHLAPKLLVGAFCCGVGFCLTKYLEWGDHLRHGFNPGTNDFWMYYYILTGLHFFHLLLGMGVLAFLYTQSREARLGVRQVAFVEGGACFWHMVDLLWIVLFALLYLVK